ncbi:TetR family transcriptional regulator [Alicyclobacillus contaminans]|uniref:TetR/AcrR family transcriptional regulator n=1 Tax=Alicyclobacillus contaminans TaxID=392016 RepID=UPI0004253D13|nr:TetR/AcrR family transcriptional regulator [Alicyclobacillus contaminans]GMA49388.1 TetR family transcriptional regulator [Alicyclobacillus contaminans]
MPRPSQKDQILAAARRLFSGKGYHGTTIREIADEAGILSGSLYAHIQTKEDLLFEIADEGAEAFLAAVTGVMRKPGNAVEKIQAGLRAHVRVVADHLEAAKVFFHEWEALSAERRAVIQHKRDVYESQWASLIAQGMAEGALRTDDPKFARLLLLSAANWVYQWYRPDGALTPEQIADRFLALLLHGLANPASEAWNGARPPSPSEGADDKSKAKEWDGDGSEPVQTVYGTD